MTIKASALAAGLVLVLAAAPLLAHHSFAAQYDRNKPTTLTGPVRRLDWINPHARFFMDVTDTNGKIVSWEIELGPTAGLMRRGWTRTSLKIGESVTVAGFLAKDGSHVANATTVTLSNGKRIFAGSSSDDANTQ
jgi:Family of unknown function (DUF6152)